MNPGSEPRRVLDPVSRYGEIVFGLVMVLTFTCSLSVVEADRVEVREMIVAALGCNLAWGIIDAVFFLDGTIAERGRSARLLRRVQGEPDPEAGRTIVADLLPDVFPDELSLDDLERMRLAVAALPAPAPRVRFGRGDALGALGVLLLVFGSTFPVALPFFFFDEVQPGLRVSNAVALALLFALSYRLAKEAGLRPLLTGAAMAAVGTALVAVAIALGG